MILLIGASGFIGSAFSEELRRRGIYFLTTGHRGCLRNIYPPLELVINCAAFVPKDSVTSCADNQAETIRSNLIFPMVLARECEKYKIPFAHISTGFLWNDGLTHPEEDAPQRAFNGYAGFYVGAKVLADEEIRKYERHYIWRVSLAFDESDHPRNYLLKLASMPRIFACENSISHRRDFVAACLDLWKMKAAYGTYNVMNSGSIKSTHIVERLIEDGIRTTFPEIVHEGNYSSLASTEKLVRCGVSIRPVVGALEDAIRKWGG